jgi:hypothetical protein
VLRNAPICSVAAGRLGSAAHQRVRVWQSVGNPQYDVDPGVRRRRSQTLGNAAAGARVRHQRLSAGAATAAPTVAWTFL